MSGQVFADRLDTLLGNINVGLEDRKPRRVRCCDCNHVSEVIGHNDLGDAYCPHCDRVLVGFYNNGKTAQQPHACRVFEPRQKEKQSA